ncbi:hypothetical protein Mal65_53770 [Crateriforma conspicua]|nr:hypothetical protein Mal65_53770 [Crateriforma conspicua]
MRRERAKTKEKTKKPSMPGAGLERIEIHAANHGIFQGYSEPLARKAAQKRRENLNRTAGTHGLKKHSEPNGTGTPKDGFAVSCLTNASMGYHPRMDA